jgi:hypothetical protein
VSPAGLAANTYRSCKTRTVREYVSYKVVNKQQTCPLRNTIQMSSERPQKSRWTSPFHPITSHFNFFNLIRCTIHVFPDLQTQGIFPAPRLRITNSYLQINVTALALSPDKAFTLRWPSGPSHRSLLTPFPHSDSNTAKHSRYRIMA